MTEEGGEDLTVLSGVAAVGEIDTGVPDFAPAPAADGGGVALFLLVPLFLTRHLFVRAFFFFFCC